jgi:hypothetical protein
MSASGGDDAPAHAPGAGRKPPFGLPELATIIFSDDMANPLWSVGL